MMVKWGAKSWALGLVITLFCSCENETKPPLKIEEVEKKKRNVRIERFEHDLFTADAANAEEKIEELKKLYGTFFDDFTYKVLNFPTDEIAYRQAFISFVEDKDMKDVTSSVIKRYANIAFLEDVLSDAFSYYNYYYPDSLLPRVVTMNSGFNYAVVATDSVLAVGLEMYLGDSCKYYPLLGFPRYRVRTMNEKYLPCDVVKGWVYTLYEEPQGGKLLHKMMYHGKILYALDALLPDYADELKIGYTPDQLAWCKENEDKVWKFILQKKLLFSTKGEDAAKLINDSPFTAGLPRQSPGRIGQWVGWNIVRKYMKSHPEVSFTQLMNDTDYEKMLTEAKYKP